MPECPICRREFDARFQVFAPPGGEAYDTIVCARRAVAAPGVEQLLAPMLLPTIELLPLGGPPAGAPPARLSTRTRRRLAAAIAIPLVASPAAVAAGLSLVAAGTATSVYLGFPAFEGGGRVVAAPAPPAELPKPEPFSEVPTPPPSVPVTDEPEQPRPKPEPKARVVVLAGTPSAYTVTQRSEVTENPPAQSATQPGAAEGSTPGPHAAPATPHGRPTSPPSGASPHVSPPPPTKPTPPAAPPPATTPPPEAVEEPAASPPPPPRHDPHSASAAASPDPHATDKDKGKGKGKDKGKDKDKGDDARGDD